MHVMYTIAGKVLSQMQVVSQVQWLSVVTNAQCSCYHISGDVAKAGGVKNKMQELSQLQVVCQLQAVSQLQVVYCTAKI